MSFGKEQNDRQRERTLFLQSTLSVCILVCCPMSATIFVLRLILHSDTAFRFYCNVLSMVVTVAFAVFCLPLYLYIFSRVFEDRRTMGIFHVLFAVTAGVLIGLVRQGFCFDWVFLLLWICGLVLFVTWMSLAFEK